MIAFSARIVVTESIAEYQARLLTFRVASSLPLLRSTQIYTGQTCLMIDCREIGANFEKSVMAAIVGVRAQAVVHYQVVVECADCGSASESFSSPASNSPFATSMRA